MAAGANTSAIPAPASTNGTIRAVYATSGVMTAASQAIASVHATLGLNLAGLRAE